LKPFFPILAHRDAAQFSHRAVRIRAGPEWVLEHDEVRAFSIHDGTLPQSDHYVTAITQRGNVKRSLTTPSATRSAQHAVRESVLTKILPLAELKTDHLRGKTLRGLRALRFFEQERRLARSASSAVFFARFPGGFSPASCQNHAQNTQQHLAQHQLLSVS